MFHSIVSRSTNRRACIALSGAYRVGRYDAINAACLAAGNIVFARIIQTSSLAISYSYGVQYNEWFFRSAPKFKRHDFLPPARPLGGPTLRFLPISIASFTSQVLYTLYPHYTIQLITQSLIYLISDCVIKKHRKNAWKTIQLDAPSPVRYNHKRRGINQPSAIESAIGLNF